MNLASTARRDSTSEILQHLQELEQSVKSKFFCMSIMIVGYDDTLCIKSQNLSCYILQRFSFKSIIGLQLNVSFFQ